MSAAADVRANVPYDDARRLPIPARMGVYKI
jgi:hypothetical protein